MALSRIYLTKEMSRAARGALDISQRQLAALAYVSESTIRDFEKGRRVPAQNNLLGIQAALEAEGIHFNVDETSGLAVGMWMNAEDIAAGLTKTTPKSQAKADIAAAFARRRSPLLHKPDQSQIGRKSGLQQHLLAEMATLLRDRPSLDAKLDKNTSDQIPD